MNDIELKNKILQENKEVCYSVISRDEIPTIILSDNGGISTHYDSKSSNGEIYYKKYNENIYIYLKKEDKLFKLTDINPIFKSVPHPCCGGSGLMGLIYSGDKVTNLLFYKDNREYRLNQCNNNF